MGTAIQTLISNCHMLPKAGSKLGSLASAPGPRGVLPRFALASFGATLILAAGMGCAREAPDDRAGSDSSAMSATPASSPVAPVDTQRVALSVKGMYCESCESTVSAMLRRTPGVLATDVSVERSEAVIMYDSTRTSPTKLVDVIGTLGYTAALKGS